jgi:hypothetical protein
MYKGILDGVEEPGPGKKKVRQSMLATSGIPCAAAGNLGGPWAALCIFAGYLGYLCVWERTLV